MHFKLNLIHMKTTNLEYISPQIQSIEMKVEGVLCASADNEFTYGGDAFGDEE